ncbi:MAG TPA: hypothetical protein VE398_25830 [Acidobacteriota bacterium]|nr:hypothetical protein [Acidobacteriota bacterium]
MEVRIPERHKRAGVCYAVTDDGIELPVIDMTHPAFAFQVSETELPHLFEESIRATKSRDRMPAFLQRIVFGLLVRGSVLGRAIMGSEGTFVSGMVTYLMKLGPENLGDGYAGRTDRKLAAALPPLSARIRLRDMARLISEGLTPALSRKQGQPIHLLNIGGGPASDSLNALILIRRDHPELLSGRKVLIQVLDLDDAGPSFGSRAMAALMAEGAPLQGVEARFDHIFYDWAKPAGLRAAIQPEARNAVVVMSSEGGLFEYGSDDEIVANLEILKDCTPDDAVFVGSVTKADGPAGMLNKASKIATQLRSLESFSGLIKRAGWTLAQTVEGPLSHNVSLRKALMIA